MHSPRITGLLAALLLGAVAVHAADEAARPSIAHTSDWRTAVRQFAEANLKHPAWGASHSLRDYDLAKELATVDQVKLDDDVLYAAAYLHDVAAFAPFKKPGVDHQDRAAGIVESLLLETGFPMTKIEAVRGAIRTHLYARDPAGPEAIYLHDADALDWLGAVGIARIFGVVDPNGVSTTGPEAAAWLEKNLTDVPPRIVSPAGKARAAQRVRELSEFLRQLRGQSADFKAL